MKRKADLGQYMNILSTVMDETENKSAELDPYFKIFRQALDENKEVAAADYVKTKTAFEAGVSLYEQNVHKLTQAGQFVPAMLLGLHKKIVAAYRRFYLGCAKMNQALDYEKHTVASDMFNQAEKEQNQAMDDISKDVQKMMQKMM
ncbi:hypothetical protein SAMN05216431_11215 [Ligilactobacillus sp. WC1T17]|uniref:Uncharacterized protein n=1 Tax=Ligilactobacillus ruminis TaxID=1623 RepID=A0ABY1AD00_9LACO|nr:hypothetical protein SAMN05216431_11215 [Ligilactobacillus ruminis]